MANDSLDLGDDVPDHLREGVVVGGQVGDHLEKLVTRTWNLKNHKEFLFNFFAVIFPFQTLSKNCSALNNNYFEHIFKQKTNRNSFVSV